MDTQGSCNEEQNEQSSSPQEFQFLSFTDFSQTTSPDTKRKVRSHVMYRLQQNLRVEKGKRKGKGNSKEVVLDTSSLLQGQPQLSKSWASAIMIAPHPTDLGAGRSNPFMRYPIDMDMRTHELLDHLHGDTCPMFKTMSKLGFFQIVHDEAGFRQILCTSSSHMRSLRNETESLEAIELSTDAIRSVNKRLSDSILSTSDGMILTIIAFGCHAVSTTLRIFDQTAKKMFQIMFHDIHGALTHFSGLEKIIHQRGGAIQLRSNPILRTMLFWLDVNTAFFQDRSPRFPCPSDILPTINASPLPFGSTEKLLQICDTEEMANIIKSVYTLNRYMSSQLAIRNLWDDGLFAGLYIMPVLSKFLSINFGHQRSDASYMRQEACRIGVVLYLAAARQKFGVSLAANVYIPKLKETILEWESSDMEEAEKPLLWILVIGGIQSLLHEEHQWFVSQTTALISFMAYDSWDMVMEMVNEVLWLPGILEVEREEFRREVSAAWATLHGRVLM